MTDRSRNIAQRCCSVDITGSWIPADAFATALGSRGHGLAPVGASPGAGHLHVLLGPSQRFHPHAVPDIAGYLAEQSAGRVADRAVNGLPRLAQASSTSWHTARRRSARSARPDRMLGHRSTVAVPAAIPTAPPGCARSRARDLRSDIARHQHGRWRRWLGRRPPRDTGRIRSEGRPPSRRAHVCSFIDWTRCNSTGPCTELLPSLALSRDRLGVIPWPATAPVNPWCPSRTLPENAAQWRDTTTCAVAPSESQCRN